MVKLSKVKHIGTADSVDEALMYKNYLKKELNYDVDNLTFNLVPGDGNSDKVEFTLSYKDNTTINVLP